MSYKCVYVAAILLACAPCTLAGQSGGNGSAAEQKSGDEPIFQVGSGVTAPSVTHQVQPEHPTKGFRISGTVLIGLVVTSAGEPKDVHVVKSLEKDIDQSAVDAVLKWHFDPAKKDGKPVAVRISVEIRFHDM